MIVTLRIGGFDVKKVMINQGSGVEIMYADLNEGLGLTFEDLKKYDSPLVAFDGSIMVPTRQVTLLVEVEGRKEFPFYSNAFILSLYGNSCTPLDPYHGCYSFFVASKSEVPN